MDIGLIVPNYPTGASQGRMREGHALIGLGGRYGVRVARLSAKKS